MEEKIRFWRIIKHLEKHHDELRDLGRVSCPTCGEVLVKPASHARK
jgi:hypothetical protein